MDLQTIKGHLIDVGKGLIAAMLSAMVMAAVQYLGAHVPDAIQFTLNSISAIIGVKSGNTN